MDTSVDHQEVEMQQTSASPQRSASPEHLRGSGWRDRFASQTAEAAEAVKDGKALPLAHVQEQAANGATEVRERAASAANAAIIEGYQLERQQLRQQIAQLSQANSSTDAHLDSLRDSYESQIGQLTLEAMQVRQRAEAIQIAEARLASGAAKRQQELQFEKQRAGEAVTANRQLRKRVEQADAATVQAVNESQKERQLRAQLERVLSESRGKEEELREQLMAMRQEKLQQGVEAMRQSRDAEEAAARALTIDEVHGSGALTIDDVKECATELKESSAMGNSQLDVLMQQSVNRQRQLEASFEQETPPHRGAFNQEIEVAQLKRRQAAEAQEAAGLERHQQAAEREQLQSVRAAEREQLQSVRDAEREQLLAELEHKAQGQLQQLHQLERDASRMSQLVSSRQQSTHLVVDELAPMNVAMAASKEEISAVAYSHLVMGALVQSTIWRQQDLDQRINDQAEINCRLRSQLEGEALEAAELKGVTKQAKESLTSSLQESRRLVAELQRVTQAAELAHEEAQRREREGAGREQQMKEQLGEMQQLVELHRSQWFSYVTPAGDGNNNNPQRPQMAAQAQRHHSAHGGPAKRAVEWDAHVAGGVVGALEAAPSAVGEGAELEHVQCVQRAWLRKSMLDTNVESKASTSNGLMSHYLNSMDNCLKFTSDGQKNHR